MRSHYAILAESLIGGEVSRFSIHILINLSYRICFDVCTTPSPAVSRLDMSSSRERVQSATLTSWPWSSRRPQARSG